MSGWRGSVQPQSPQLETGHRLHHADTLGTPARDKYKCVKHLAVEEEVPDPVKQLSEETRQGGQSTHRRPVLSQGTTGLANVVSGPPLKPHPYVHLLSTSPALVGLQKAHVPTSEPTGHTF